MLVVDEDDDDDAEGGGGGGATGGGPSVGLDSLFVDGFVFVGVALGVDVVDRW